MTSGTTEVRQRFRVPVEYDNGAVAGHVEWWADEEQVGLGSATAPRVVELTLNSDGDQPMLRMRIEVIAGVPQVRQLTIEAVAGGREISLVDVRSVRFSDWIEVAIGSAKLDLIETRVDGTAVVGHRDATKLSATTRSARRARSLTDEVKRQTAEVYLANLDGNPTQAVAKHFFIQPRSAGKYVALAEEAGYLKAPSAPGAKRSAPDPTNTTSPTTKRKTTKA